MSQGRFWAGCLGLALVAAGFAAGAATVLHVAARERDGKLAERLDRGGPIRPAFLRDRRTCETASNDDDRLDRSMLEVADEAARIDPSFSAPVARSVVSHFAWHWRLSGQRRCPPADAAIARLAPLLERAGWPRANTELNDLRLAERMPASRALASGLASIAFLDWIPPSQLNGEDARPFARQLLAEQQPFAQRWGRNALAGIGADTRLGTSAAYLAIAIDPQAALPKVEQAMRQKLARSRLRRSLAYQSGGTVRAISPDDGNRLIELGYALARAGPSSRRHAGPVLHMLEERIARPAPPFGLMAAEPTEFCRIAHHIGGTAAQAAERKPFCKPGYRGGDGAPREF